jgi:hypothetical protein
LYYNFTIINGINKLNCYFYCLMKCTCLLRKPLLFPCIHHALCNHAWHAHRCSFELLRHCGMHVTKTKNQTPELLNFCATGRVSCPCISDLTLFAVRNITFMLRSQVHCIAFAFIIPFLYVMNKSSSLFHNTYIQRSIKNYTRIFTEC